jgi:hypothetical protein
MLASAIGRVLVADQHVGIALQAPALGKHAEACDEGDAAIRATEAIGRVHLTLRGVGVARVGVDEELATETPICRILATTRLVQVPHRLAIGHDKAHDAVARDKGLVAVHATETIHGVLTTKRGVPIPRVRAREEPAAKASVPRVLLARELVRVAQILAIAPPEAKESSEGGDENCAAKLARESVLRIHLASDGVRFPGVGVREELPAEALVLRVPSASRGMAVAEGPPIRALEAHDIVACHELLGAEGAQVAIRWVPLAQGRVRVPRCYAREDTAAIAAVGWILLAHGRM